MSKGFIREKKNKDGTVKKGVFEIIYDAPRQPGQKRNQKSVTVHGGINDARKKLREILRQIDDNLFVDTGKMTLRQFLKKWFKDYCEVNLAQTTRDSYRTIIEKHLIPILGDHQLVRLQPLHLQEYYSYALAKGRANGKGSLSPKTVHSHHRVLHRALETAIKWQLVSRNIADAVEPPKLEQFEAEIYGEEEIGKLLKVSRGTALYVPVLLALATGLRRGELLGLRWKDVDIKNNVIAINQSLLSTSEGLQFKAPKTKKSRRTITVPETVMIELEKHKKQQIKEKFALGDAYAKNDLVICREDGTPWHPGTFSHHYQNMLSKNKLMPIRFHDLRHTHASLLLQQGVHPKIVSERLGHSQIGITLDIYSHILPGIREQVAQDLDERLFKKACPTKNPT